MVKLNKQKIALFISISFFSAISYAKSITPILPDSSSIQWVDATNLPKGAKLAILVGHPHQKEFYVARLKLPANFLIPAHSHLTTEYNTVISGSYYVGIGNGSKPEKTIRLPAGSFITFPAGAMHYGFTREETILEVSGIGPWGTMPHKLKNAGVV